MSNTYQTGQPGMKKLIELMKNYTDNSIQIKNYAIPPLKNNFHFVYLAPF